MSRCGESSLANWPCRPGNCPRCGHVAEEGAWACEDAGQCLADQLRARLAEVEAELASEAEAHRRSAAGRAAAEARLAEVERALGDELANLATDGARLSHSVVRRIEAIVRAAAAGDRAEAEPVYPFGTPCRFAGTGCGEEYCTCAKTVGHFCPIECVTCGAAGDDR